MSWKDALKKFFRVWKVTNTALQAQLATVTFVDNAAKWWEAHLEARPDLMLSFPQLCEWITRELVPLADPEYSTLAWYQLQYRGNIDAYFHHLDNLLLHHPLSPRMAHMLAVQPFGQDAVERILAMNDATMGGLTLLQLKRQIRYFAQITDERRRQEGRREGWTKINKGGERVSPVAFAANTALKVLPPDPHLNKNNISTRREGSAWCLICGSLEHIWTSCALRKPKGCTKYGSTAHYIRACAQRLIPPWHRNPDPVSQLPTVSTRIVPQTTACCTFPNNIQISQQPPMAPPNSNPPLTKQQLFVNCLSAPIKFRDD